MCENSPLTRAKKDTTNLDGPTPFCFLPAGTFREVNLHSGPADILASDWLKIDHIF